MHPNITKFTSEIYYENKLESLPELKNQVVSGGTLFDGAGLFFVPVTHVGNRDNSSKEVDVIPTAYKLNTRRAIANLLNDSVWEDFTYVYSAEPQYYFGSAAVFQVMQFMHKVLPNVLTGNLFIFLRKR